MADKTTVKVAVIDGDFARLSALGLPLGSGSSAPAVCFEAG